MSWNSAEKLIIALDGMDEIEVFDLIRKLPSLKWVKVGLELFVSAGPKVVIALREKGLKVFLDLKFHDIPITMSGACRQAAKLGVDLITVHACAGIHALKTANIAAAEAAVEVGITPPKLLGVTVLTSWDSQSYSKELCINQSIEERVLSLANLVKNAGLGGCICSPLEVMALRNALGSDFELVTPGVRPKDFELQDQVRIMSPSEAIKSGADRLVIGRPITNSFDPLEVFESICQDMEKNSV